MLIEAFCIDVVSTSLVFLGWKLLGVNEIDVLFIRQYIFSASKHVNCAVFIGYMAKVG